MKKIVTHINPDLDAIVSVWLIKRFLPTWEEAEIGFVSAGEVKNVDDNPDVLHVDTGLGKLDHHHTGKYLSAGKLTWQYIQKKRQKINELEKNSLQKLIEVATQIDNARELNWPEVKEDRFKFYLHSIISNLRGLQETDEQVISFGFRALDAVLLGLKSKLNAQEELLNGIKFQSQWGKAIAVETSNEKVLWEGETQGFFVVARKDPSTGGVRIYCRYDSDADLTKVYNTLRKLDPESDWFLHATKKLLLNTSRANPGMHPTKLSLKKIIEVLKGL